MFKASAVHSVQYELAWYKCVIGKNHQLITLLGYYSHTLGRQSTQSIHNKLNCTVTIPLDSVVACCFLYHALCTGITCTCMFHQPLPFWQIWTHKYMNTQHTSVNIVANWLGRLSIMEYGLPFEPDIYLGLFNTIVLQHMLSTTHLLS